jgi:hypothetical protein
MLETKEELACLCASSEVKSQNGGLIPRDASANAVTPTVVAKPKVADSIPHATEV